MTLHYVLGGEGPRLVLLPETCYAWRRVLPTLAEHITVPAPDLRGLGDSCRPPSGCNKNMVSTDVHVHELVVALGYDEVDLVGTTGALRLCTHTPRVAEEKPSEFVKALATTPSLNHDVGRDDLLVHADEWRGRDHRLMLPWVGLRAWRRKQMERSATLLGVVTLLALGAAACGGSNSRDFERADLPRLVFSPSEAPVGTKKVKSPFGFRFLEQEHLPKSFMQPLRDAGMQEDYGIQFEATSRETKVGFVETIAFLSADEDKATKLVDQLKALNLKFFEGASEARAPKLGDSPFAVNGAYDKTPVLIYGWRTGDVVQLLTVAGKKSALASEADRLGKALEARAAR
jgi:hypothetical protein